MIILCVSVVTSALTTKIKTQQRIKAGKQSQLYADGSGRKRLSDDPRENYAQGESLFASHFPDLVIPDLGLPDRDGLHLIVHIQKIAATPIMVLSARSSEYDKVTALDLGANDYITKPFSTQEALARIRATLRSSRHANAGALASGTFTLGDMVIDYDRRSVTVSGEPARFTQTEFNLLALFSEHVGQVLTYTAIVREVWVDIDCGSIKKLQVNMANIRKKLGGEAGCAKVFLQRTGYRLPDAVARLAVA